MEEYIKTSDGKVIGIINGDTFEFVNSKVQNFYGIDLDIIKLLYNSNIKYCIMTDSVTREVFEFPLEYYLNPLYYIEPTYNMHLKLNQRLVGINRIQGKLKKQLKDKQKTLL